MLSGEGQTIELGELKALLDTYNGDTSLESVAERVYIARNPKHVDEIVRRGAYLKLGGKLIGELESSSIVNGFQRLDYCPFVEDASTFAVKLVDFTGGVRPENIEADLGASMKTRDPHLTVSLESPDILVAIIVCSTRTLVGAIKPETIRRGWSLRRPRARPFFHPAVLYPKFARALVNLAKVKPGEILLDPFCGTGSILLEAGLVGVHAVGLDINRKMCKGSLLNLSAFGVDHMGVLNSDAARSSVYRCDAIVTDVPYGRASSTRGMSSDVILGGLAERAKAILPKDRHAVIVSPETLEPFEFDGFQLIETHRIYVHRNLTRLVRVLRRS